MTDGMYELRTPKRCLTLKIKVHGYKTCRFLPADFSEFSENTFNKKKTKTIWVGLKGPSLHMGGHAGDDRLGMTV